MNDLRDTARQWLADGRPAVLVSVTEAQGSAPREAGTRMLVAADALAGTVGGGHLELKAISLARGLLAPSGAEPGAAVAPLSVHFPLGPALGQCCGGAVTLALAPLDAAALAAWPLDGPMFHLQLYGAGHVGRAIVQALMPLPVRIDWIDEREAEFARFAGAAAGPVAPGQAALRCVCVDAVEGEVRLAPPGAFYLVLTHEHDLDWRIAEAILRRGDFGYFGLIGSKTKRQRFIHRFEQRGLSASAIDRMTCPIGVPGIDGKAPEVIAAAVVAQLLQRC